MIKNDTFYYLLKKMYRNEGPDPKSDFLEKTLTDSFKPSADSIKNIMAFSDAYVVKKVKNMGNVEFIIN